MIKSVLAATIFFGAHSLAFAQSDTSSNPVAPLETRQINGSIMFDYQTLNLTQNRSLDLLGYHVMAPINDWLSFGLGSYAPVAQGEYGGFMGFGGIFHAQKNITENVFWTGGVSFGGGGGGRSTTQSTELSGTGGYFKSYLGVGYQFDGFSAGVNVSKFQFGESAINSTQANVFLKFPIGVQVGRHSKAGQRFSFENTGSGQDAYQFGSESMLSFGLDNYRQIDPVGTFKGTLRTVDLQYSKFMNDTTYWYYAFGVGYQGLPTFNQVVVGAGARLQVSPKVNLYGQLGIGSGGYAPAHFDTGSGLLVYPKVSAEYKISDKLGLALTTGYLIAPDGTSENVTYGVSLNRHFGVNPKTGTQPTEGKYRGYRFNMSHETKVALTTRGAKQESLNMFTGQLDRILSDNVYMPMRGSISYESFRTFPGYGEISMGLGLQTKYNPAIPLQMFGSLQAGVNVDGLIMRADVGMTYGLSEEVALRAAISQTKGVEQFNSTNVEFGVSYRFSRISF